jgi:hypothetical protein
MTILTITKYSEKSIVVRGRNADDTRSRKEELKNLGGKYNPRLRDISGNNTEPGWVFTITNQDRVQEYIERVNKGIDEISDKAHHLLNYVKKLHQRKQNLLQYLVLIQDINVNVNNFRVGYIY